jgi:hypothetical protein
MSSIILDRNADLLGPPLLRHWVLPDFDSWTTLRAAEQRLPPPVRDIRLRDNSRNVTYLGVAPSM